MDTTIISGILFGLFFIEAHLNVWEPAPIKTLRQKASFLLWFSAAIVLIFHNLHNTHNTPLVIANTILLISYLWVFLRNASDTQ
jgi:hypothetical protein